MSMSYDSICNILSKQLHLHSTSSLRRILFRLDWNVFHDTSMQYFRAVDLSSIQTRPFSDYDWRVCRCTLEWKERSLQGVQLLFWWTRYRELVVPFQFINVNMFFLYFFLHSIFPNNLLGFLIKFLFMCSFFLFHLYSITRSRN